MKYNRILLKLSGEAIGGPDGQGLDEDILDLSIEQKTEILAVIHRIFDFDISKIESALTLASKDLSNLDPYFTLLAEYEFTKFFSQFLI